MFQTLYVTAVMKRTENRRAEIFCDFLERIYGEASCFFTVFTVDTQILWISMNWKYKKPKKHNCVVRGNTRRCLRFVAGSIYFAQTINQNKFWKNKDNVLGNSFQNCETMYESCVTTNNTAIESPSYSPDLALYGFYLFLKIKRFMNAKINYSKYYKRTLQYQFLYSLVEICIRKLPSMRPNSLRKRDYNF